MEEMKNNLDEPDNNALDENGFFLSAIKLWNYIQIICSPLLVSFAVCVYLVMFQEYNRSDATVIIIIWCGLIAGIIFAERVRRRKKLTDYGASLSQTPDVDKWMEEHRKEHDGKKKDSKNYD